MGFNLFGTVNILLYIKKRNEKVFQRCIIYTAIYCNMELMYLK